jgi:hypothetical protein
MKSEIDDAVRLAKALPLYDAAYKVWISRRRHSNLEVPPAAPKPKVGRPVDWNAVGKIARSVMAAVEQERANAPSGKTFDILKAAHPDLSDITLKDAIQTAVDFERAYCKNFKYTEGGDLREDADRAVQLARLAYPQYEESTYRDACFELAFAMR